MNATTFDFVNHPLVTKQRTVVNHANGKSVKIPQGVSYKASISREAVAKLKQRLSESKDEEGLRSYVILLILLATGMRVSELVLLKRSDIGRDDKGPYISFSRPNRNDRHTIRLSRADALKILLAVARYHRTAKIRGKARDHVLWSLPFIFSGERVLLVRSRLGTRSVQKIVIDWGLRDDLGRPVIPYGLRHCVGRMATRSFDFVYAQKLLGHVDPKTTSHFYTDPSVPSLEI